MKEIIETLEKFQITVLAVIIAIGAMASAKIVTSGLAHDGISVTGSAYEIVKSDSGKMTFNISTQAKTKAAAYQLMKQQLPTVKKYLEEKGVPKEISNELKKLLNMFTKYNNNYAKHADRSGINVLEYIMYQTGNIMRLMIKLNEPRDLETV